MSKIEIEYNGALAICKVDGKYLHQCDKETIIKVLSAFRCIEQSAKRDNLIEECKELL